MHSHRFFHGTFILISLGLALPLLTVLFSTSPGTDPAHRAIDASAWITAIYWYLGMILLVGNRALDKPDLAARGFWLVGSGFAILHTAIAFHCAHGWSHTAAYEYTARVGGVGWGLYVNYLFVVVWIVDCIWLVVSPCHYQNRPRWMQRSVHGFLGFIVFQATVVFGSWPARLVFGLLFFVFFVGILREKLAQRDKQSRQTFR